MENKKQLIIIPPMSEALRKLNEVLEGIAVEENMEISIIDDLKELSQFLGTTGQCLILASNAKKCASFLQENKSMLAKSHCKTILFTPKEIPAKTLIKFTKIGLTESILENSPPKTFVYKVKLLLRSIKTAKPQDDAEKVVKSIEANKSSIEDEKETKEKSNNEETSMFDSGLPDKKKFEDSADTIDYGTNLKGKNKHQEEAIDTNWRSERKKEKSNYSEEEAEDKESLENDSSSIDMYYRGKQQKKVDLFADEDPYKRSDKQDEEASLDKEKKKHGYLDEIQEGSIKQKRLGNEDIQDEAEKKAIQTTELDLINDKKNKEINRYEEEEKNNRDYTDTDSDDIANKKNKSIEIDLEIDGALKGKIHNQDESSADDKDLTQEMEYESSRSKNKKSIELDLEAADKDLLDKKEDDNSDADGPSIDIDDESGPSHMGGKDGQVDRIETMMTSRLDPKKDKGNKESDLELEMQAKNALETEARDLKQESLLSLEDSTQDRKKDKTDSDEAGSESSLRKNSLLDGIEDSDKDLLDKKDEDASKNEKNRTKSDLDVDKDQKNREKTTKDDAKEIGLRSLDKFDPLAKKERDHTHNGQVDKIDTFYRSGDVKKNEQNWDDLNKRNASVELLLTKNARAVDGTQARETKDLGEITIDYRKLKEEFDMISNGEAYVGENGISGKRAGGLKDNDDEGSFRVIEIDPKSLDFAIHIINAVYEKEIKPKKMFTLICSEILSNYHCYPIFYTYKLGEKKFTETFNVFTEASNEISVAHDKKEWWQEFKKDTALFEQYQSKSMTTWRCPEIIKDGIPWEDVELPSWAGQELIDKRVELVFPYFDGIDRMGMALIFFPEGIDPKKAQGLLTLLEMARTLFLDTIERYQVRPVTSSESATPEQAPETAPEKKSVLGFFGGLFGKKKAG